MCDFAQYYNIYDYERLPVETAAVLACGLPPESRTVRKISGVPCGIDTQILAAVFDRVNALVYARTKDARHGRNRPKSLLAELLGRDAAAGEKPRGFKSAADFEAARKRCMKRGKPQKP